MKHTRLNWVVGIIALLVSFNTSAQEIHCYDNPLIDSIWGTSFSAPPLAQSVTDQLKIRQKSLYYYKTLMQLQEPSALSIIFTDYTIVTSGDQKKPFILNADVQTPIAIGGKRFHGKHGKWLNTVHINPQFKVRIFNDDTSFPFGPNGDTSLPVRTPSTIPGITYFGAPARLWDDNETSGFKLFDNLHFGIRVFHHSNGQDGNELDTLRPANLGKVNLYNGNFGQNVVFEIIVGAKTELVANKTVRNSRSNQRKLARENRPGKQIYLKMSRERELYWRLGYEFHPWNLSNEVFRDLAIYGRYRLNLTVGHSLLPSLWEFIGDGEKWCDVFNSTKYEQWRFTFNSNYILDRVYNTGNAYALEKVNFLDASKRLNLWLTAYRVIRETQNAALFMQAGYYGSDNYNIYFTQSMWQFRFGLAFGAFNRPNYPDKQWQ